MLLALRVFLSGFWFALRRVKLVLWLYLAALATAVALALPLWLLLGDALGHATVRIGLHDRYDWEAVLDFLNNQAPALHGIQQAIGAGALVFFLFGTLLSGGVYGVLAERAAPASLVQLGRGCGRYFFRFLRAEILFAILIAGVYFANLYLAKGVRLLFTQWVRYDATSATLSWTLLAKTVLSLALLGVVLQAVTFAKLGAVVNDDRSMLLGTLRGLGLVLRHPLATLLPLLLSGAAMVAVVLLQGAVRSRIPVEPLLLLDRMHVPPECSYLVVSQAAVLLGWWVLVARFASQLLLFRELGPAETAPVAKDELQPLTVVDAEDPVSSHAPTTASLGLLMALACLAPGARAQQAARTWNQSYQITATLKPESHTVSASEKVTFANPTDRPLGELRFHLYANAFANDRTTWMREAGEIGRVKDREIESEDDAGYIAITRIRRLPSADGSVPAADLSGATRIDETVMTVTLDPPLAPHGTVACEIEFTTKLPAIIARMGFAGEHHDVMQWFPKLGAFVNGEWVCPPFHAATEFFADFGTYDVSIRVPRRFHVEATGIPSAPLMTDAQATYAFHAENVHDFAFCADPNVVRKTRDHRAVEIVYLCQPYALAKADRVLDVVAHCLDRYGEWFFPYPYPRIVVDGVPFDQSGGMEYPMLFTISERAPQPCSWLVEHTSTPAGVTIHEFGHQYWYGLLASNEFDEAWLDEGVNSYVSLKLEEDWFGRAQPARALPAIELAQVYLPLVNDGFGLDVLGVSINPASVIGWPTSPFYRKGQSLLGFQVAGLLGRGMPRSRWDDRKREYFRWADADTLEKRTYELYPGSAHPLTYSKTALALRTLENHFGWPAVRAALKTYAERFRFAHPTGKDFLAVLEESLGEAKARPFVDQLFRGRGTVDFAVTEVASARVPEPRGFALQSRPGAAGGASFVGGASASTSAYQSRVVVRNLGEVELPVEVRFTFADGRELTETWDGRIWKEFRFGPGSDHDAIAARLVAAEVDPRRLFALERNVDNNGRRVELDRPRLTALCGWVAYWVETLLQGFAFFW